MVRDTMGNELKPGAMVMMAYNNQPTVARVLEIREAGAIGVGKDQLKTPGMVVLQIIVPMEFMGDVLPGVWTLRLPSNQERAMQQETSENPS